MGILLARLPRSRLVDNFDFTLQPSLDAKLVRELERRWEAVAQMMWVGRGAKLASSPRR